MSVNRDEVNDDGEVINGTPSGESGASTGQDERKLLKSIVDFGDTLVREVMTPRPDIVAIPADATLDDLRALFREQEYSRIPVFRDNLDNILGFVYVKDLILLGDSLQGRRADHQPLCGRRTSCPRRSSSASCCASSSTSAFRARSSSTSTAAPRAS